MLRHGLAVPYPQLLKENVRSIEHGAAVPVQRQWIILFHEYMEAARIDQLARRVARGDVAQKSSLGNAILGEEGADLASDFVARVEHGEAGFGVVLAFEYDAGDVERVGHGFLGCRGGLRVV